MSAWAHALELAAQTPPGRNRYDDFLRAPSITAAIFGHWLIAEPWTQWHHPAAPGDAGVPGRGYANSASWEAAQRAGTPYGRWTAGRARRLIGPVVPLVPMWFLAVYLLVVLLVPVTHGVRRRGRRADRRRVDDRRDRHAVAPIGRAHRQLAMIVGPPFASAR